MRSRHRLAVAAEAVVEHRVRPFGDDDPDTLAPVGGVRDGGFDPGGRLSALTAQSGNGECGVRRRVASGRLGHGLDLVDECSRGVEIAAEQQHVGAHAERER